MGYIRIVYGNVLKTKTCQGSLELVLYFDVLCMKLYDFYDLFFIICNGDLYDF